MVGVVRASTSLVGGVPPVAAAPCAPTNRRPESGPPLPHRPDLRPTTHNSKPCDAARIRSTSCRGARTEADRYHPAGAEHSNASSPATRFAAPVTEHAAPRSTTSPREHRAGATTTPTSKGSVRHATTPRPSASQRPRGGHRNTEQGGQASDARGSCEGASTGRWTRSAHMLVRDSSTDAVAVEDERVVVRVTNGGDLLPLQQLAPAWCRAGRVRAAECLHYLILRVTAQVSECADALQKPTGDGRHVRVGREAAEVCKSRSRVHCGSKIRRFPVTWDSRCGGLRGRASGDPVAQLRNPRNRVQRRLIQRLKLRYGTFELRPIPGTQKRKPLVSRRERWNVTTAVATDNRCPLNRFSAPRTLARRLSRASPYLDHVQRYACDPTETQGGPPPTRPDHSLPAGTARPVATDLSDLEMSHAQGT